MFMLHKVLVILSLILVSPVWAADVLNRTTKEFNRSVNTPDFLVTEWIIGPDLSAVQRFSSRYWIITGDVVTLMTLAQRTALDQATAQAGRDELANQLANQNDVVIAAIIELLREINSDRPANQRTTAAEFKAAVRVRLGN